eukprot:GHVL01031675.1.p1 GENE.GHVL01031675.1~~GHVL01031675.1.p1  ORF type:complete len:208 (+),score=63.57 GHVL01031675.1:537-1160(+)
MLWFFLCNQMLTSYLKNISKNEQSDILYFISDYCDCIDTFLTVTPETVSLKLLDEEFEIMKDENKNETLANQCCILYLNLIKLSTNDTSVSQCRETVARSLVSLWTITVNPKRSMNIEEDFEIIFNQICRFADDFHELVGSNSLNRRLIDDFQKADIKIRFLCLWSSCGEVCQGRVRFLTSIFTHEAGGGGDRIRIVNHLSLLEMLF